MAAKTSSVLHWHNNLLTCDFHGYETNNLQLNLVLYYKDSTNKSMSSSSVLWLSKSLAQAIINQKDDRTAWYTPCRSDTHPSIKPSNPLRSIHRFECPNKSCSRNSLPSRP